MQDQFTPVASMDGLNTMVALSSSAPVVIFKHDPYCPVSMIAYREMARLATPVALIDVAASRDVSFQIAEQTGITHESPQVLVLRDGRAVWAASHFDITHQAVRNALAQA